VADIGISIGVNLDEFEKKLLIANKELDAATDKASTLEKVLRDVGKVEVTKNLNNLDKIIADAIEKAKQIPLAQKPFLDPNKVFISDIIPKDVVAEDFKNAILEGSKRGLIALSRIDLVQALPKEQFAKLPLSEVQGAGGAATVQHVINLQDTALLRRTDQEKKADKERLDRLREQNRLAEEESLKRRALERAEADKIALDKLNRIKEENRLGLEGVEKRIVLEKQKRDEEKAAVALPPKPLIPSIPPVEVTKVKDNLDKIIADAIERAKQIPLTEKPFLDPNKVFISDIIPKNVVAEDFKNALLEGSRRGLIALSRIDLVQALPKNLGAKLLPSEVQTGDISSAIQHVINLQDTALLRRTDQEKKADKERLDRLREQNRLAEEESLKRRALALAEENKAGKERLAESRKIREERAAAALPPKPPIPPAAPPIIPPTGGGGVPGGGGFDFRSFIEGSRSIAATRNEIVNLAKAEALLDVEIKKVTNTENEQAISIERVNQLFKQSLERDPALKIEANEARLLETIRKLLNAYEALGTGVVKAGEQEVTAANAAISANERHLASLRRTGEEEEKRRLRADQIARVTVQAELEIAGAAVKNLQEQRKLGEEEEKRRLRADQIARAIVQAELQVAAAVAKRIEEQRKSKDDEIKNKINEVTKALRTQSEEFKKTGQAGVLAGTGVEEAWTRVQRFFVASVITRVLNQLSIAFKQSVTDAATFQIQIAELRTISQENQLSFDQWAAGVRKLSEEFGRPSAEIAAGVYEALSAQVGKGAQAFEFLEKASQLARTTQSSTAEAVRATSDTLNAFGLTIRDQDRVSAALFKTVDLGNVRLRELSGTLGRVGFTANALGISFEQVFAGLSLITRGGIRADEAITFLNNAINQLAKPTDALKEFFQELGVATGEEAIKVFGFTGFLSLLAEKAQNSASVLAALGGELRATKAFFALAQNGGKNFIDEVNKIKDSKEAFESARKEFENLPGEKFRQQQEKIKNFFTIDVGQGLVNSIAAINDGVVQLSSAVKAGTIVFIAAGAVITTYKVGLITAQVAQNLFGTSTNITTQRILALTGATKVATATTTTFGIAIRSALIGTGIGIAVVGITFAIGKLIEAFDKANERSKELQEGAVKAEEERLKLSDEARDKILDNAKAERDEKVKGFISIAAAARVANEKIKIDLKAVSKTSAEALKVRTEEILAPIRELLSQASNEATKAKSDIEAGRKFIAELRTGRESKAFETQLKFEGDPGRQVRLIENQIRTLQTKRSELETKGDIDSIERARKLTQEIIRLQEQRFETEANIRKRQGELGLIPTGERINVFGQRERIVDLTAEQLRFQRDLNKEIERQEAQEAKIAEAREKQIAKAKEQAIQDKIQLATLELAIRDLLALKTTDEKGKLKPEFAGKTPEETFEKVDTEVARIAALIRSNLPPAIADSFFKNQFVKDRLKVVGEETIRASKRQAIDNAALAIQSAQTENDARRKSNEKAIENNRNDQKQALNTLLEDSKVIIAKAREFAPTVGSLFVRPGETIKIVSAGERVIKAQKELEENIKAFEAGDKSSARLQAIAASTRNLETQFSRLGQVILTIQGEEAFKKFNTVFEAGGKVTKTTGDIFDDASKKLQKFKEASTGLEEAIDNVEIIKNEAEEIGLASQTLGKELLKLPGITSEVIKQISDSFDLSGPRKELDDLKRSIEEIKKLSAEVGKEPPSFVGPPSPTPFIGPIPTEIPTTEITPITPAPIQTPITAISKAETFTTNIGGVTINFSSTSSLSPDIVREVAFLLERQFSSGNIPDPFRGNGEVT